MFRKIAFSIAGMSSLLFSFTAFDGKEVPSLPAPSGDVVNVTNLVQLRQALINQASGQTIMISAGTYNVGGYEPLEINVSNLTIRGAGDDNTSVVWVGNGFGGSNDCASGEEMIKINTTNFTIANLTLSEVRANCLKIQSGGNHNCVVHNVRFLNIGERMIKGPGVSVSRDWDIRYCHFEDTKIPVENRCNDIAGGNYIAGMDLMSCDNFNIHDNVFMNIKGATGDGRGAIFTWNGSSNMNSYRNLFIGNDKAICYWAAVTNGTIKNNFIVAGANLGARIDGSTGIKLYNNTSFTLTAGNGAFTFDGSSGCEVKNNIIYGGISVNSGSAPDTSHNILLTRTTRGRAANWFGSETAGDLHIKSDTCSPVNRGMVISGVTDDWDGLSRDGQPDIGADEFSNNPMSIAAFASLPSDDIFLAQAEPNPFNPSTLVRYFVPAFLSGSDLALDILSPNGAVVKTLKNGPACAGSHAHRWDARANNGTPVTSGLYIIRLTVGSHTKTAKVTFMK